MKRIVCIVTITATPLVSTAQTIFRDGNFYINMEMFRICTSILGIALIMIFILSILKRILEYRIKNKIADKGISENLALSILQPSTKEDKSINFKWFLILAGIGIGLILVNYTLPLGIHSLAIMAFSIAASFLGYHYFLKRTKK